LFDVPTRASASVKEEERPEISIAARQESLYYSSYPLYLSSPSKGTKKTRVRLGTQKREREGSKIRVQPNSQLDSSGASSQLESLVKLRSVRPSDDMVKGRGGEGIERKGRREWPLEGRKKRKNNFNLWLDAASLISVLEPLPIPRELARDFFPVSKE